MHTDLILASLGWSWGYLLISALCIFSAIFFRLFSMFLLRKIFKLLWYSYNIEHIKKYYKISTKKNIEFESIFFAWVCFNSSDNFFCCFKHLLSYLYINCPYQYNNTQASIWYEEFLKFCQYSHGLKFSQHLLFYLQSVLQVQLFIHV